MSPAAVSTAYSPLTTEKPPAPSTRNTAAAELAGGGEPNRDGAAGAGAKGEVDAAPDEPNDVGGAAGAPAADPAGRGTSEGIIAAFSALTAKKPVVVKGLHPSVPHPVDGGLSSVDGTE